MPNKKASENRQKMQRRNFQLVIREQLISARVLKYRDGEDHGTGFQNLTG